MQSVHSGSGRVSMTARSSTDVDAATTDHTTAFGTGSSHGSAAAGAGDAGSSASLGAVEARICEGRRRGRPTDAAVLPPENGPNGDTRLWCSGPRRRPWPASAGSPTI